MLDVVQTALIAYSTEDGEIIHVDGAPIRGTSESWRENDRVMEEYGYNGRIRYSIHEMESENWEELTYNSDFEFADQDEYDYQNETVKGQDVSSLIGIFCDKCSKRIE